MNLSVTCSAICTDERTQPISSSLPDGSRIVQYHGADYCVHSSNEFYADSVTEFSEAVDIFCEKYGYDKGLIKLSVGHDGELELYIKLPPILREP